ncbi:hypothetical protein GIB67_033360 [Kingdonia uniflora]|uniref:Uncharacterized protein n=1 Tax=Kingdonia uniflora TaxID=39325 RepID=A0A7J7LTK1_9MAGN|nr:hypothetical protein GIB67_033360 [Kingdonia uniflora]
MMCLYDMVPRLSSIRREARKKPVESIVLTTSLQHPARLSYIKQQARIPNDQHYLLALMQDLDTEATSFDVNGTIPMLGISQGALRVTLEGARLNGDNEGSASDTERTSGIQSH